ncbi:hypothetical protein DP116_15990 [Brasilonema bromeliae SPC951]|uniref:Uncharacterized protein n=1 Tax=Brasilonema bromeliae SPC951 TaxID=385972 RepID=A0ABX1PAF6_9CYAN|nr:hypothetical protein [Brasilonema bromeliae SPC951]
MTRRSRLQHHQRDIFSRLAIAQGGAEAIAFTATYLLRFAAVGERILSSLKFIFFRLSQINHLLTITTKGERPNTFGKLPNEFTAHVPHAVFILSGWVSFFSFSPPKNLFYGTPTVIHNLKF